MPVARRAPMHTAETAIPVLDDSVLSELQTLGADVVAEIIALFLGDVPVRLARLKQAIGDRSRDMVVREAHGLKGSALGVGASRFARLCAAIEHSARDGELDRAVAYAADLDTEFEEARGALNDANR
jgi:histidine phosphotransfer protein HptB